MTSDLKVLDHSIYIIVDGPSWTEAETNANKLGGHLVTINDAEENQWLVNNLSGSNDFYSNQYVFILNN